MTEKPTENSDEDRVSLKSTKSIGIVGTLRKSIRRVAEKNPLSPGNKGAKVTPKADTDDGESGFKLPPSPSKYFLVSVKSDFNIVT